jgi:adenylate cyclase
MTGAGDQDYFVDGMMEEIVSALSRFRSIFVIAGAATLSFKGRAVSAQEVARELGVRYVLEGSVRKAGERVRIAVKLIDAEKGEQIWGERFEDTLEDVFALQDRIALGAAGVIEPAVREAEIRRSASRPTANLGSYDLYLRALAVLRTYVWSDMAQAIALTERAIELDPAFGQAWSLAARCHYLVHLYGWADDGDHHREQAVACTRRAVRAAPDDAQVLAWAAMLHAYLEHDLPTALAMADRAIALNPGAAQAWFASGAVRIVAGQLDLAVDHLDRSIRLNPVGPDRSGSMLFMTMARFQQLRFEDACALARELFQHFENPTGCAILAAGLAHLGQIDAARAALDDFKRLSRQPVETFARLVWPLDDQRTLFLNGIALAEG